MGVDCCLPLTDFIFCFSKEARKHHGNQMHRLILLSSLRSLQFFSLFFFLRLLRIILAVDNLGRSWYPCRMWASLSSSCRLPTILIIHQPRYTCCTDVHTELLHSLHTNRLCMWCHMSYGSLGHTDRRLWATEIRTENIEVIFVCLLSSLKIGKSVSVEGV